MHVAGVMDRPGVKEDALGERRLAGVDMRRDANVPRLLDRNVASHGMGGVGLGGVHGDSWLLRCVVKSPRVLPAKGNKIGARKTPLAHFEEAAGRKEESAVARRCSRCSSTRK